MRTSTLTVDGNHRIALRRYVAQGEARANVVIGAAMGVPQTFYQAFAQWLAAQGVAVWTFDYRGSGESLGAQSLRGFQADLFDWARDYDAVIEAAKAAQPTLPLYLMGHSLGAQLPGLLAHPERVDGMLSIAAGSGYWRENAPRLRRGVLFFWHLMVPTAVALCGYFPGRRLRVVGDLPRGVMLQWRRWCLNPRYSVGAEGESVAHSYARVRFPVLAWSMSDDEMMTWAGTQSLLSLYANAPQTMQRVTPEDAQARRIGHFGFFRAQFASSLWPKAMASLDRLGALGKSGVPGVPHTTA